MKHVFRFFRGELNGYYISILCTMLNKYVVTTELVGELVYQKLFQWITPSSATKGRLAIREEDIFGLGSIAGLFRQLVHVKSTLGSIWFTPPYVAEGVQRSERGLLDIEYQRFMFIRTRPGEHDTDINTLATEALRTTYREEGAVLLGYVSEDDALFDEAGNLLEGVLLETPPVGKAYVEWYGLKYLHYREYFDAIAPIDVETYMLLFNAMQRIRRHGVGIKAILDVTELICKDYVGELRFETVGRQHYCYYSLNQDSDVKEKEKLFAVWEDMCELKFKMFTFIQEL